MLLEKLRDKAFYQNTIDVWIVFCLPPVSAGNFVAGVAGLLMLLGSVGEVGIINATSSSGRLRHSTRWSRRSFLPGALAAI